MSTPTAGSDSSQWRISARGGAACDVCRRRKTRCIPNMSVEGGPCDHCGSAGITCSFAPRLRGPPTTYVESLELRLEATQELLRKLSTSSGIDLISLAERSSEPAASCSSEIKKAVQSLQQQMSDRQDATPEVLETREFKPPGHRLVGLLEGRFAGRSAGPTLAAQMMDDYYPSDLKFFQVEDPTCLVEDLLAAEESTRTSLYFALPPQEIVDLLVNAFFHHINDHLSLLHQASFMRLLTSGEAETSAPFRSLVFVVSALGTRFVTDSRLRGDWSAPALFRASCCQHRGGFYRSSVAALHDLQAITLSVIYLLGAESSLAAWEACGAGLRAFVDVGAHLESIERWKANPLTDQLRKRSFFLLFSLDHFISFSLGRPVGLQENDYDLAYPVAIDDESLDRWANASPGDASPTFSCSTVEVYRYLAALSAIHSRTFTRLYSPGSDRLTVSEVALVVEEEKRALDAWLATVPAHLMWDYNGAEAETTLHCRGHLGAGFAMAKIALIRPLILKIARTRDTTLALLEGAFAYGSAANREWDSIVGAFLQRGIVERCFYWIPITAGHPALVSFHILRTPLVSGRYLLSVAAGLHRTMRALQAMKDSTPQAAIVFESCKALAQAVNQWRPADNFDYTTFLLSPSPAPLDLYLTMPPFSLSVEEHLERQGLSSSPSPPTLDDTVQAYSVDNGSYYPFRPDDWSSQQQISDNFPDLPSKLVISALTDLVTPGDIERLYQTTWKTTFSRAFPEGSFPES